jgi:hypothetical protein
MTTTNRVYSATDFIDRVGTSLDGIDGAHLQDKDMAIVCDQTNAAFFSLDDDSAWAEVGPTVPKREAPPTIIEPNLNPGDRRWLMQIPIGNNNYVLNTDHAGEGTDGTGEDTLFTYTMPANTMKATDCLRFRGSGQQTNGQGDNKEVKFYFGSKSISLFSSDTTDDDYFYDVLVMNINNVASQRILALCSTDTNWQSTSYDTSTENTASSVIIKLTGECAHTDDTAEYTFSIIEILSTR